MRPAHYLAFLVTLSSLWACVSPAATQTSSVKPLPPITHPDTHLHFPFFVHLTPTTVRDVCTTCPYTKIRDAVLASGPGDIVRVRGGNYQENMTTPSASITIEYKTPTSLLFI
jgi:hypothetical protein